MIKCTECQYWKPQNGSDMDGVFSAPYCILKNHRIIPHTVRETSVASKTIKVAVVDEEAKINFCPLSEKDHV